MILLYLRAVQFGVQFYSISCEDGALQNKECVLNVKTILNVSGVRRCKEIIDFLMFEMVLQESVQRIWCENLEKLVLCQEISNVFST
jgi:hypothetical protein